MSDVLDWRVRARCRESDARPTATQDPFHSPDGAGSGRWSGKTAKWFCGRCDVRAQCLAYALETGQDQGIWGGYGRAALRRMRGGALPALPPPLAPPPSTATPTSRSPAPRSPAAVQHNSPVPVELHQAQTQYRLLRRAGQPVPAVVRDGYNAYQRFLRDRVRALNDVSVAKRQTQPP